ncbi:MAG: porin family protein [Bacteroidota bacterium]
MHFLPVSRILYIAALGVLAVPLSLCGQILIGPVAGPQVSWVSFENKDSRALYNRMPFTGFHAGMGLSFRVHQRFFLNGAFLYSSKGKNFTGVEDDLLKVKTRYHYIDVPMAYTVEFVNKVGKTKQYKWYFGLGPHVSYWLGGKGTLQNTQLSEILVNEIAYRVVFDQTFYADNEMNVTDPNRVQLGLNLSAGFVFEPLGFQKIMVNLRYEVGHSYFSRNEEVGGTFNQTNEYVDDLRTRNQGFRLSLAYLVDLKTAERKKGKSTIKQKKMK